MELSPPGVDKNIYNELMQYVHGEQKGKEEEKKYEEKGKEEEERFFGNDEEMGRIDNEVKEHKEQKQKRDEAEKNLLNEWNKKAKTMMKERKEQDREEIERCWCGVISTEGTMKNKTNAEITALIKGIYKNAFVYVEKSAINGEGNLIHVEFKRGDDLLKAMRESKSTDRKDRLRRCPPGENCFV